MAQTDDLPAGPGIDPEEVLEAVLVFLEHVASRDFDEELQGDETKAAELVPLVRKALGR